MKRTKTNTELLSRLMEAEVYLSGTKYQQIVNTTMNLFTKHKYKLCEQELSKLPTPDHLSMEIIGKLKDKKHIYTTLRQICRGKKIHDGVEEKIDGFTVAKGLSSLLTHVIIECQKGNLEFRMLIPIIQERLNEEIHNSILVKNGGE